ncbi:LlaJI family restriction endonuclease [Calothrix sp. HK-06]|nr:LlaJI family restriction endonuclease [Calothrix sp. HK-06]
MINFSELKLIKVKEPKDNFVGIRKSKTGNDFEFCLPNGFQDFPEGDFDKIRELFFKMYRTFRKFERDNKGTNRFQINKPQYQQEQDQTNIYSGGLSLVNEQGEACVIYSKLKMIERVLEAYDDLAINSIHKKIRKTGEIDYSQIYKYLDRAIYLDNDVIYVEAMALSGSVVLFDSDAIVKLYCYILDEVVQQLDGDVPENIQAHRNEIRGLSQCFKDGYLTNNQSIFDKSSYAETISILKEILEKIDKNTHYKDAGYWGLYEAVETFLYGELKADEENGEYWGVKGFSLVWEDICHTYFFKKFSDAICFADADITLENYSNAVRQTREQNRVGNYLYSSNIKSYANRWIYSDKSHIPYPKKPGFFRWHELLCIELDTQQGTLIFSNRNYDDFNQRDRSQAKRRFPCPDLILKHESEDNYDLYIIDYKDVPIDFYYKNWNKPLETTDDKFRIDIIKQLTYELALQQTNQVKISKSWFIIPNYLDNSTYQSVLCNTKINIKGIQVVQADFFILQKKYLGEN